MAAAPRPQADYKGARGSNAGDQFHELWALSQVLRLLDPASGLTAVTVEGIPSQGTNSSSGDPTWDGVDCALFFGGTDFASSTSVELAQLKYSGDPTKNWTISRLTQSAAKSKNNSVLRKLADDFAAARSEMSSSANLKIRFVSNQHVSKDVIDAINAEISGSTSPNARVAKNLNKLTEAAGLSNDDLVEFFSALNFTDCGSESRFAHREKVISTVAKLIEDNATSDMAELHRQVRNLMLPERHDEVATRGMVLSWLGIADERGLFPCPPEFEEISDPVSRNATVELASLLVGPQATRVAGLHGPGGCGKTTALQLLPKHLPEGSTTVFFDCYGGGKYLYPEDRRHLPENAFLQIANEIAVALQAPLFIPRDTREPMGVRVFLDRVTRASQVISGSNPDALLTIVVDAADNAVSAFDANSSAGPCFAHELAESNLAALPENVRIVFSTRTARIGGLKLPKNTPLVECPVFTLDETRAFVHRIRPNADGSWIDQFHYLSNGIPRVQNYALKGAVEDGSDPLDLLRPSGKSLDDVFES